MNSITLAALLPLALTVAAMAQEKAKAATASPQKVSAQTTAPQNAEMAGYMLVGCEQVPAEFNAGFSLYAAAWPLLEHYPGHRFQTGLFGTWMHAQYEGAAICLATDTCRCH